MRRKSRGIAPLNREHEMSGLARQLESLGIALGQRDEGTQAHCRRVELLSLRLSLRCGLSAGERARLVIAARLHDVGKMGIADAILLKPNGLLPDEWEAMKVHSILGQRICDRLAHRDAQQIGLIVRHHHEAYDGSGYPDGLSGERIPLCSRIISVADVYDAMTSTRPYHMGCSHERAMEILRSECGKFDPQVFAQFERMSNAVIRELG